MCDCRAEDVEGITVRPELLSHVAWPQCSYALSLLGYPRKYVWKNKINKNLKKARMLSFSKQKGKRHVRWDLFLALRVYGILQGTPDFCGIVLWILVACIHETLSRCTEQTLSNFCFSHFASRTCSTSPNSVTTLPTCQKELWKIKTCKSNTYVAT